MPGSSFSECQEVLAGWNELQAPLYRVRASDLKWNLTSQKQVEYRKVTLGGVPAIVAQATADGIAAGLSERSLWLSLWGGLAERAVDPFVAAIGTYAIGSKKQRIVIGADEFHFVCGVPQEGAVNQKLQSALKSAGFSGSEEVDYQGDLYTESVEHYITEAVKRGEEKKWTTSVLAGKEEQQEFVKFLDQEFPGRWAREYRFWLASPDSRRAFWLLLKDSHSKILGFSRLALRERVRPLESGWTPGALRLPFQGFESIPSNKDCCLGPIGVSLSLRGQGAGKVILGSVLQELRRLDAGPLCIDWTNAFKYYEPLHFSIVRKYLTMAKNVGPGT
jgi:hypothetical protein